MAWRVWVALVAVCCVAGPAWAVDVTVQNQSAWTIYRLYLSPTSQSTWGDDQLGNQVISTGDSFQLNGLPCDTYDIRLIDEDSDECVLNNVRICDSETWVITSEDLLACQGATNTESSTGSATYRGGATSIEIVNQSAWAIHYFYLSPVADDVWGPDQLGASQVIGTGGRFEIDGVPCGDYDVRMVDEDGDECVVNAVDICSGDGDSWVITSEDLLACQGATTGSDSASATYNRGGTSIRVTNQSAWAIHYFYMSPVTDDSWGDDQLGSSQVIGTGGHFDLQDVPCGNYDIKLVDEDGDDCVMNDVNICEGSREWVISSEALLACQAQ